MSVFSVKEWWSCPPTTNEEYDLKSICILSNQIILTASLQGILRAYKPHRGQFTAEDLLFELTLQPILQLDPGYFSHTSFETVGVLHSRSFEVFIQQSGSLKQIYELKLQRNAFNFTFGKFGTYGNEGRDFICIQSSDGALGFYEQENYLFAVQLPGFLLPGPLVYCNSIDCFLICNSNMQIEAYKFSRLKEASISFKQGNECTFNHEWRINIGEYAQDIQFNKGKGNCDVYVLGEHTLFGIKLSGHLKLQKKLDYVPSCMCIYDEDAILIGSFSSHLLLYKGRKLFWAARMNSIPIHLKVANFDIKGLILSLDEKGVAEVSYLGTNPMPYIVTSSGKNVDIAEADKEYRRIMGSLNDTAKMEPVENMEILVQVEDVRYVDHVYDGYAGTEWGAVVSSVKLGLKFSGDVAKDVCIHVSTPDNIECIDSPLFIPLMKATTPAITTLKFLTKPNLPCNSLDGQINLTYVINNLPRTATSEFELPFFQICQQSKLQKEADYKITLTIKDPISSLSEIFPDFKLETPNALSLKYFDGSHCTAILGKSGERCRLQGSSFHTLWLLSEQFSKRLTRQNLSFDEALPLQDFFSVIDKHLEARKSVKASEEELAKLTEQYTAIQKRLLVRFKDKNPAALNNLDYLLQLVHSQVAAAADSLESVQDELLVAGQQLSCAVSLILELLRLRFGLDDRNMEVIRSVISPHVQNYESGWEECTNAALTYLLRTKLAKSEKESKVSQTDLVVSENTDKLKKHITIVFDRISKGSRVA